MKKIYEVEALIVKEKLGINITEEDLRVAFVKSIDEYSKINFDKRFEFKFEEKVSSGHTDASIDNFVIEFKKPSVKLNEAHEKQIINYLKDKESGSWGILTNGKEIRFFFNEEQEPDNFKSTEFSGDFNVEVHFDIICQLLETRDKIILNSSNIGNHLGVYKNKDIIKTLFGRLENPKSMNTSFIFGEWLDLFNYSLDDKFMNSKEKKINDFFSNVFDMEIKTKEMQYKCLFAVQTFYSINIKLLFAKKIDTTILSSGSAKKILSKIEDNSIFEDIGILNILDCDFYDWYLEELVDKEFSSLIELINNITIMEVKALNNSLITTYYENIFPFHVRHAMGEYYTPSYLAKNVIDNALKLFEKTKISCEVPKILDPTCGSGVFLIEALRMEKMEVYGIDINPIAILTAKINYLFNMDFRKIAPFEIPIYLGDSTFLPPYKIEEKIQIIEYSFRVPGQINRYIDLKFPIEAITSSKFLSDMNLISKDHSLALEIFQKDCYHYETFKEHYQILVAELEKIEYKKWINVIANYLKAATIREVDIIVGNPPWVSWKNLPEQYRLIIKEKCRISGAFSDDKNFGGVDLNLSALIAYVTIEERLSKFGMLGFLMPDSILFNKSSQGFRKLTFQDGNKAYFQEIIRWNDKKMKVFNGVSLEFSEYYISYNKVEETFVEEKKTATPYIAKQISKTDNNFTILSKKNMDNVEKFIGTNNLKFRSGISLPNGGIFLLDFIRTIDENTSEYFVHTKKGDSMAKSDKKIILENDIVFPYIKSPDINDDFICEAKQYCIFPYDNSKEPISLSIIQDKYPLFYNYFTNSNTLQTINSASEYNKRIQSNKFSVGIIRVGKYTYGNRFIATRDNTKSVFSFIEKIKMPWGEKKIPIFDSHINYLSDVENEVLKNEDTAKKLFKKLKKPEVKMFVASSTDSRSISSRVYNNIDVNEL